MPEPVVPKMDHETFQLSDDDIRWEENYSRITESGLGRGWVDVALMLADLAENMEHVFPGTHFTVYKVEDDAGHLAVRYALTAEGELTNEVDAAIKAFNLLAVAAMRESANLCEQCGNDVVRLDSEDTGVSTLCTYCQRGTEE